MKGRGVSIGWPAVWIVLALGGLAWPGHVLLESFSVNRKWTANVEIPSASTLDADLFALLASNGAIWPERQDVTTRIAHTPCNSLTLMSPEGAQLVDGPAGREGRKHVRELCESPQGERIREEIANFNRGFLLVAVSDNRNAAEAKASADGVACADGVSRARLFVPDGCLANEWTISVARDGRPAQSVPDAAISPLEYAFLATSETGYFGDWRAVAPFIDTATGQTGDHVLRTTVKFGGEPLRVRTVGLAVSVAIDGAIAPFPNGRQDRTGLQTASGGFFVSAAALCAQDDGRNGERAPCSPGDARGRAAGSYVTIEGPAGSAANIEIVVKPMPLAPRELRRHRAAKKPAPGVAVNIGAGLTHMRCAADAPAGNAEARGEADTGCALSWIVPENAAPSGETDAPISVKAGELLVLDAKGTLSEEAFDLGYGGLVGLGTDDAGSVAQALARSGTPEGFALTIDPQIQALAMQALAAHFSCPDGGCARRADLVVLDAEGATAGEVLAIASLPRPPAGLSAWDLETLERAAPSRSPMAAYGWRNHDLRATPGSTFKLVTALTASQYVLDSGDRELEDVLFGRAGLRDMAGRLGIIAAVESRFNGPCTPRRNPDQAKDFNALPVPGAAGDVVFCIGNAAQGEGNGALRPTLGSLFEPAKASGCGGGSEKSRAGLCEALKESSNLFFAGLALALDGDKLLTPGTRREHTREADDLLLARMAARLFPARSTKEGRSQRNVLDLLDVDYPSSGRARSSPLVVDASLTAPAGEPRRLRLARGGIGLSVSASPLAIATVAASIATGRIVRPHAVPRAVRGEPADPLEGTPVLEAPAGREALRDDLLEEIRRGMAAVVKTGTAASAMRSLPPELKAALRAKTGTAPLVDGDKPTPPEGRYAAWVAGYVEPPAGKSGITRRIAFACRIANSEAGGGKACGPVIRDFVMALHKR